MERAREYLRKLLRRGIERGVFPVVLDEDLGVALLLGPMMYRHIFGSSVSRDWLAEGTVNSFWKAHARPEYLEKMDKIYVGKSMHVGKSIYVGKNKTEPKPNAKSK